MKSIDDRVEQLEMEIAHHQRTVEQLNEVVTGQSHELLRLTRIVDRLVRQYDELKKRVPEDETRTLEDDKPPHY